MYVFPFLSHFLFVYNRRLHVMPITIVIDRTQRNIGQKKKGITIFFANVSIYLGNLCPMSVNSHRAKITIVKFRDRRGSRILNESQAIFGKLKVRFRLFIVPDLYKILYNLV